MIIRIMYIQSMGNLYVADVKTDKNQYHQNKIYDIMQIIDK